MSDCNTTSDGKNENTPECESSLLEPAVELTMDYTEEQSDNYYPFESLSVEINEGLEGNVEDDGENSFAQADVTQNYDSLNSEIYDSSSIVDSTVSESNELSQDASAFLEEQTYDPQDLHETNLEQFIYPDANCETSNHADGTYSSSEESKDDKRYPLSKFPRVVKSLELADYETVQNIYQLLYESNAWDTEEILKQRILEFTGFNFNAQSEAYFNREMMLKTLPDVMLIKIGHVLGLDHIQKIVTGGDKARCDLIAAIMQFLTVMRNLTRARRRGRQATVCSDFSTQTQISSCGCRGRCLARTTKAQRRALLEYLKELEKKNLLDSYLFNLLEVTHHAKKDDAKKTREVAYQYKVKFGPKEFTVCKGGFAVYHGLGRGKVMTLLNKLKSGNIPPKVDMTEFPHFEVPKTQRKDERRQSVGVTMASSSQNNANTAHTTSPIIEKAKPDLSVPEERVVPKMVVGKVDTSGTDEAQYKVVTPPKRKTWEREDMIKALSGVKSGNWGVGGACKIFNIPRSTLKRYLAEIGDLPVEHYVNLKVGFRPTLSAKVAANSVDINSSPSHSLSEKENDAKAESEDDSSKDSSEKTERKKLKDFPLVVAALGEASEELLVDMHFLLFLDTAKEEDVKENILNFSGFTFDSESEEFDERNEFLQRMSSKIISDVATSFSLAILSNKEDTIKNILAFLQNPNESFLKIGSGIPLTLSDVELDDIDGFSDSDESITCEVVEKKVECIDLISSGEDSDDDKPKKAKSPKKIVKQQQPTPAPTVTSVAKPTLSVPPAAKISLAPEKVETKPQSTSTTTTGGIRRLKDFETICKIVNTHPHEYLIDIFDLLYMKKHEPTTLRNDILDFSGFTFDRGSQEYTRRKQFLDRMLYNSVRRIYNTLIHNTTEVKVFSKPTMITEIFQFLFKLPDHDTSVRPSQSSKPVAKPTFTTTVKAPPTVVPPTSTSTPSPNQNAKLSDLKRVFQRVACFPCEYLIDVHKLLFMTDCDPKVIRQNIFAFKGFSFGPESPDFQQRKMYLEYLTFHSLRKISSVLTTRSVDLRNSTKHELASHLTQVLAEYCNTHCEAEIPEIHVSNQNQSTPNNQKTSVTSSSDTAVENIVVTPTIDPSLASPSVETSSNSAVSIPSTVKTTPKTTAQPAPTFAISIVDARSVSSPAVTTTSKPRKRKGTVSQLITEKKKQTPSPVAPQPVAQEANQFADINLPEVEKYRQMYGQIYNPNLPTITGITTFSPALPQAFPMTQAVPFPIMQVQPSQVIGVPLISQVQSKPSEVIVPVSNDISDEQPTKKQKTGDTNTGDDEEDCDKPLASLIGHPNDTVLKKNITDVVEQTDLQDITINGVIQKVFAMYPKYDLTYRKEFIKSTVRSLLYKLGEKNAGVDPNSRDTNSPDCSVTTTDRQDNSLDASGENSLEASS